MSDYRLNCLNIPTVKLPLDETESEVTNREELLTLKVVIFAFLLCYHLELCPVVLLLLYWREVVPVGLMMMKTILGSGQAGGPGSGIKKSMAEGPRNSLPSIQMHHSTPSPSDCDDDVHYDAYYSSTRMTSNPTSYHPLYPTHHLPMATSSGGSGASSPSTESRSSRPRSSASTHRETQMDTDDDDLLMPMFTPRHSTPRRSSLHYSQLPPPPPSSPPSAPASSVASSQFTTGSSVESSPAISLATVLDVFQHNISEPQAWALIFQSVQSLSQLISDYEANANSTESSLASSASSATCDSLELVELKNTSDLLLDPTGSVHSGTWLPRFNLRKVHIKNATSINIVVAHLAGIIYKAITFELILKEEAKQSQKEQASSQRKVLETNLDSDDEEDSDQEEDFEPDIQSNLENLLIYMISSKDEAIVEVAGPAVDEGIVDIDDEERLLSHLSKSCIPSVVKRCVAHFEELWSELLKGQVANSNNDFKASPNSCSILVMLYENRRKDTVINADLYYQTVIEQMLDEYTKLKQLLKHLSEIQDHTDGSTTGGGPTAFRRSSHRFYAEKAEPDTENLKIWAQTWIKVMSELRFGIHLKHTNLEEPDPRMKPPVAPPVEPFNALMAEIRETSRDQLKSARDRDRSLKHSRSLPILDYRLAINRDVIREQRNSLKPASKRVVKQRPPEEPCLHEKLMKEIQSPRRKLAKVKTVVKPDMGLIVDLYFKEQAAIFKRRATQSKSFPRVKSAMYLSRVRTPDIFAESDESDQFTFDDLSTSNSSLCRCSSVNSNHAHTNGGRAYEHDKRTTEEAAKVSSRADDTLNLLRRFKSMSVHKLTKGGQSKRKNQAADDSFNTSLPRTPERTSSTPFMPIISSSTVNPKPKDRRQPKKSKHYPDLAVPLSSSYPTPPSLLANSHSPIPSLWVTKPHSSPPKGHHRPISYPSATSLSTSTPTRCPHHNPSTSNPSFVHSYNVPCTCQPRQPFSPIGSTSSIFPEQSTPPRLLTFNDSAYLRRSFIKRAPTHFDNLTSAFGSMRRSNSVMFPKERTNSNLSSASKSSKWSFTNLVSKLIPGMNGNSLSPSKVKRE